MSYARKRKFNLPYLQSEIYWLNVFLADGVLTHSLFDELKELGFNKVSELVLNCNTGKNWAELWAKTYDILKKFKLENSVDVALDSSEILYEGDYNRKKPAELQVIVENMWVGDALQDGRVLCYFQPIVSYNNPDNNKIFGYESFIRAIAEDGNIIGGDKIIKAAKALNIEYNIDRYAHVQAIKTFATSDCSGSLFLNFMTGFIQRPEVYLEGINDAIKLYKVVPQNLVLGFKNAEALTDNKHLKNICEYAKSQKYMIAIEDVNSNDNTKKLMAEIRPDFVKINSRNFGNLSEDYARNAIREIVDFSKNISTTVIAERIETEENLNYLKALDIGLFQGYYFSPAIPIKSSGHCLLSLE